MVYQRGRYGQISYSWHAPKNPKTPRQCAVRSRFASVSARWSKLSQEQREVWHESAKGQKTRPRLGQRGPLGGFSLFMKVNVPLANLGQAQLDLPSGYPWPPKLRFPKLSPSANLGAPSADTAQPRETQCPLTEPPHAQLAFTGLAPPGAD
jgi:hypothetical protein